MSDASSPNVITIDGRAIEYRLERRGDTTALILHGGHMSAQCRFGEETFLEAGYSVLVTSRPGYGRTAVSAGPSAPEFAIRLAGLSRLLGLGNLTVVGISLGARSAIPVSTSHAAWDVDAVHGVHAAYSVNNVGTALVFVEEWPARRGLHVRGRSLSSRTRSSADT
jgi:pimeloyl-ACP methyl ester carboxylesterase